ncbi:MAG: class D sortase [Solirubrobacteraceae bacterium]
MARFAASVALVSGVLLVADGATTLLWQEPISALFATWKQHELADRLQVLTIATAPLRRHFDRVPDVKRRLAELAAVYRSRTQIGGPIGRIYLPTLGRSYIVVQGTNTASLEQGPGHYPGTDWPGQGGTVAIAGHRTTFLAPFRTLNELRPGQPIILQMPYGRFIYQVQYTRIVLPTDLSVTRSVGYDRLVLSACNPLFSADQRIVAFARLARAIPATDQSRGARARRHPHVDSGGCVSPPRPGLLSPCSPALSETGSGHA